MQLTSRNEIRQQIRQARRSLSQTQQQQGATQAAAQFIKRLKLKQGDKVAIYLTNDGELNTQPLIDLLWQQGIELYLPRLHPFSPGNLLFFHYQKHTPMVSNQYGIDEPKLDIRGLMTAKELDIIITPLVAFDALGNRMGMGGGYYDRTLATRESSTKPLAIGYAHNCQQVEAVPCEHWDIPLTMIITPEKVFDFE